VGKLTAAYSEGFVVQYFKEFVAKVGAVGVLNGPVAAAPAFASPPSV